MCMGPHVDATNSGAQVKITAPQFIAIRFQLSGHSRLLAGRLEGPDAGRLTAEC